MFSSYSATTTNDSDGEANSFLRFDRTFLGDGMNEYEYITIIEM